MDSLHRHLLIDGLLDNVHLSTKEAGCAPKLFEIQVRFFIVILSVYQVRFGIEFFHIKMNIISQILRNMLIPHHRMTHHAMAHLRLQSLLDLTHLHPKLIALGPELRQLRQRSLLLQDLFRNDKWHARLVKHQLLLLGREVKAVQAEHLP